MEAQTDVPLSQGQQGSSDLPPTPGSSQVIAEVSPQEGALRYVCSICHASYAQRQGVWRHIRTVHNPKQCFLCEFRWARPYEYRNHLKKKHPGVDPDLILGKAPGSRRRSTILTEHLPQQPPVSQPVAEQGQQNCAESQPNPWAPSSPTPAGVTSVSPPVVSSVDYNLQPVHTKQTVTTDEHEYTHRSEVLDATYHLAMPLSTEERAEPMNGLDLQDGQFGLPPCNLEMAHISTFSPPVGEIYGALVSEGPTVGSFRPMRYSPLSDAGIDANFDSMFSNSTF